jgi:hypothetical protein
MSETEKIKICSHCGVELENHMNYCPVCGAIATKKEKKNLENIEVVKKENEPLPKTDYQKLTLRERRKLTLEITGLILLSGIFITVVIDFITAHAITWSRYPLALSIVVFINIALTSFLYNYTLPATALSWISTTVVLLLLAHFTTNISWLPQLVIPIIFSAYLIVSVMIIIIKNLKKHGLNIIGLGLLAAGFLCVSIEITISLYAQKPINPEWSLIVFTGVTPGAVLLFFLHHRLKKKTDLKRFFHI